MTGYDTTDRAARLRVARSRGAISGLLLVLLGLWGALVPFVGPYADYAYTPDSTWTWTAGRFWLEVLPGAAAVLGGILLLVTANRVVALFGAWLAAAAGAWFVVGPVLSRLWDGPEGAAGTPVGGTTAQVVEQIGFFSGVGAAILLLGAHAAGRLSVISRRDRQAAERRDLATERYDVAADRRDLAAERYDETAADTTAAGDREYQPDVEPGARDDNGATAAGPHRPGLGRR